MVVGLYLGLVDTVDKTPCGGWRWSCLESLGKYLIGTSDQGGFLSGVKIFSILHQIHLHNTGSSGICSMMKESEPT